MPIRNGWFDRSCTGRLRGPLLLRAAPVAVTLLELDREKRLPLQLDALVAKERLKIAQ